MEPSELWALVGIPLLIFAARTADVSLGTVRIILLSRGQQKLAPLVGFVEILIWLMALGQVVQHLDRPLNYVAYAGGFASGTYMGMWLEERLALGLVSVRVITTQDASPLIEALKEARFGVTSVAARGLQGRVRLIYSIIRRSDLPRALGMVRGHQPRAFVSVSDVRSASEGFIPDAGRSTLRLFDFWRKGK